MKYVIIIFSFLLGDNRAPEGQDIQNQEDKSSTVPLSKLFYKMGGNALHSVTYNYGANYAVAALGSYGLVKSGIDWKWNRLAYNNAGLAWSGTPFGVLGYIVPIFAPVGPV